MKTSAPACLMRLRDATRHIHQAVEAVTGSDRLLVGIPTLSHYRLFLGAHLLLHEEVARHSVCANDLSSVQFLDWPECPRIPALADDLVQLGVEIDVTAFHCLPYVSPGFLLGLVYVCEGSCIGNQRVLTALNGHDRFHHWNSNKFLSTCKPGFADRWKSLLALMQHLAEQDGKIDESAYQDLERGAISGFQLYVDYWQALDLAATRVTDTNVMKAA